MRRLTCLCLLALLPALAAGSECRYSAERNFDVPASDLANVTFQLGSSDLIVEGAPGLDKIEVRGRACASNEAWLDQLTVEQHRAGDRLEISTREAHDLRGSWSGSNYAYIDLRVRMPSRLTVALKTSSGDAEVRSVAALDVDTSSGDLVASHIAGVLGIQVSSGDVRGEDIGSVDIRRTSSGDITLRDVHGPVEVARSGSGDLHFRKVGSVHVGHVGSGDVSIIDAAGDVVVDSIGSGDIRVDRVAGDFRVGSRGSGDVEHRGVQGKVSVPHDD